MADKLKSLISKLPTGYQEEADTMSADELRAEIVKAEASVREVEASMAADTKLTAARELVKDLSGGYNDAKSAQRAKIGYALHILDEKGELGRGLGSDEDATTGH